MALLREKEAMERESIARQLTIALLGTAPECGAS